MPKQSPLYSDRTGQDPASTARSILASLEASLNQSFAQMYGPGLAAAAAAKAKQTPVSLPPKPVKTPWSTTKKVAVGGAAVAAAGAAGAVGAHLAGLNVLGVLAGLLRRR